MDRHEEALLNYLQLAIVSEQKRQYSGRDKLLLLAGQAGCQAGLLEIADRCRDLVLNRNPHHLVGKQDHFHEMLTTEEGMSLMRQLERQIPLERVELLVSGSWDQIAEIPQAPAEEVEGFQNLVLQYLNKLS